MQNYCIENITSRTAKQLMLNAHIYTLHTHTHTAKQIFVIGLHATESNSKNVNLLQAKIKFLYFTEMFNKLIKFEN